MGIGRVYMLFVWENVYAMYAMGMGGDEWVENCKLEMNGQRIVGWSEMFFFGGSHFLPRFLKMVLPVAPPSLFRCFFDILNFMIHNVSTLFF
jgi:hypothetical protein